jgi:N6-adenosine-specific RNA methylase IME4
MAMTRTLIPIDEAMRALADAQSPQEMLDIANRAEAMRRYAQRARLGLEAQNRCAEVRLRAERKLGEYLAGTERNGGGRPRAALSEPPPKGVPLGNRFLGPATLDELGISRKLSHRAQRLAAVPADKFEDYFIAAHKEEWEITARFLLVRSRRLKVREQNRERIVGGSVNDLIEFSDHKKMGTILIDPPWFVEGMPITPYDFINISDMRRLPIPKLADDRCHLHIWCLPNETHRLAYELIDYWGFRPVAEFVWCKPQIGRGMYWRMSHEILVTGINQDRDRFNDNSLRSWIEAPRGRHSEKPDVVREMIERASPGPRIELFARKLIPDWYCWGHEIAEPLNDRQHSESRSDL